jgi:protein-arginine kinase activator protein McsA
VEKPPVKYKEKRAEKGRAVRRLCKKCSKRPVAINYRKGNKTYYRSVCDHCSRNRDDGNPLWALKGYVKKSLCDKCGFKSQHPDVFNVFHVDGDLTNCRYTNLKTVCANCQRTLQKEGVRWKQGDLRPDF